MKIRKNAQIRNLTGLSEMKIRSLKSNYATPEFPQCFALWIICLRRKKQVRGILAKEFRRLKQREADRKRYVRISGNGEQRSVLYSRNAAYRKTPNGRAKRNIFARRWKIKKYYSDPCYRLATIARARIKKVLNRLRIKKCFKTNELIGCSSEQLKLWLEPQFVSGMSWENYGTHWHVDHKLPLASFNLTDRAQLFEACRYTNLQPLTAFDNMSKGAKLIYEKKAA